jgi:hypothetical protein
VGFTQIQQYLVKAMRDAGNANPMQFDDADDDIISTPLSAATASVRAQTVAMVGARSSGDELSQTFPTLFPFGIGSTQSQQRRRTKVTMESMIRHRLLIKDPTFRKHPRHTFCVFDSIRTSQYFKSLRVRLQSMTPAQVRQVSTISDAELKEAIVATTAGNELPALHVGRMLANNMKLIASHMPFSDGQRSVDRHNIHSTNILHGPFAFNLTISLSDTHSRLSFAFGSEKFDSSYDMMPEGVHRQHLSEQVGRQQCRGLVAVLPRHHDVGIGDDLTRQ